MRRKKSMSAEDLISGLMWAGVVAAMVGCANNRIESNHPSHSMDFYMGVESEIDYSNIRTTEETTENHTQACETEPQWTLDTSGYEIYTEAQTEAYTEAIETTNAYTEAVTTSEQVTTTVAATTEAVPGIVIPMTQEEQVLMVKMMSCESGGQGIKGMCLAGMTVINRMRLTGASITEVIYAPGQYACVGNYLWEHNYVVPEAYEALALIQMGWDESQGATYFCTPSASSWHESALQFLFQYGDHRFYKAK